MIYETLHEEFIDNRKNLIDFLRKDDADELNLFYLYCLEIETEQIFKAADNKNLETLSEVTAGLDLIIDELKPKDLLVKKFIWFCIEKIKQGGTEQDRYEKALAWHLSNF